MPKGTKNENAEERITPSVAAAQEDGSTEYLFPKALRLADNSYKPVTIVAKNLAEAQAKLDEMLEKGDN